MRNKFNKEKYWALGFLGFLFLMGFKFFETKNPADLIWFVWISWFVYFIPKNKRKIKN